MGACDSRDGVDTVESISPTNSAIAIDLNGERYQGQDEIAEQREEDISAIKCIFCETTLRSSLAESCRLKHLESLSLEKLREDLEWRKVDISWCVEKADLVQVKNLVSSVCSALECQELLRQSCSRTLGCGHRCGGVREERTCLPCLEDGCRSGPCAGLTVFTSGDEVYAICMVEPIKRAPAILLTCGHVVHADCGKRKIEAGFPGPEISFTFLECPQCSQVMQHPILGRYAMKHEAMKDLVREKVIDRLK